MIVHCSNKVSTFLKNQPDTKDIVHKIHQKAKQIIRPDITLFLSLVEKVGFTYLTIGFGIRKPYETESLFLQQIQEIFQEVDLPAYCGWFSLELVDEKTMLRKVINEYTDGS